MKNRPLCNTTTSPTRAEKRALEVARNAATFAGIAFHKEAKRTRRKHAGTFVNRWTGKAHHWEGGRVPMRVARMELAREMFGRVAWDTTGTRQVTT